MSFVYVILGAPPAVLAELAQFLQREGFEADAPVRILAAASHRATLGEGAAIDYWDEEKALPPLASTAGEILLLPPVGTDPRPFLENLRDWLEHNEHALGRILTVIDCEALAENDASRHAFYDLCIHFSDVLLLGNRQNVSKKWVREYENRLHKMAVPALTEFLKKGGRVGDVEALLYPEARRLSQFFDPPEEAPAVLPFEIEGYGAEEETDDPRDAQNDPYLARGEDGHYLKKIRT